MEPTRLFDLIYYAEDIYNKKVSLAFKQTLRWISFSSEELVRYCECVAYALLEAEVRPNDKVASMSANRPAWNFVDMGIMMAGAIHVPLYTVSSDNDLIHILNETNVKIIFAGTHEDYLRIRKIKPYVKKLERIITFDKLPEGEYFNDFLTKVDFEKDRFRFNEIKKSVKPDDIATIIYTSGTTGEPKGVMLTHNNILSNVKVIGCDMGFKRTDIALSFLPLSHIFERTLIYIYLRCGVTVYYVDDFSKLAQSFQEVAPTVFSTVPYVLDKIYKSILNRGSILTGYKKRFFSKAVDLALEYPIGTRMCGLYYARMKIYDKLIYKYWRAALGGKVRMIFCGGASLNRNLLRSFWASGIKIYEGYGLTETAPVISYNSPHNKKLGTVGKIIDSYQYKFDEDGVLYVKGPCLMKGYYSISSDDSLGKDSDGWFNTGDIVEVDKDGYLLITGRKKEVFKTTSGLYVSPENIENQLISSNFIANALIVGENQNYLGVIISLDYKFIYEWLQNNDIPISKDKTDISHNPAIINEIEKVIWGYNENAQDAERIEKYFVVSDEWTISHGEVTPKLSIKRDLLLDRYREIINAFFI